MPSLLKSPTRDFEIGASVQYGGANAVSSDFDFARTTMDSAKDRAGSATLREAASNLPSRSNHPALPFSDSDAMTRRIPTVMGKVILAFAAGSGISVRPTILPPLNLEKTITPFG